jgi:hypothetical protein
MSGPSSLRPSVVSGNAPAPTQSRLASNQVTEDALYHLPAHVFVCFTLGAAIFLDVDRDKYYGLAPKQSNCLQGIVAGWPSEQSKLDTTTSASMLSEGLEVAEMLVSAGLLTKDSTNGKQVRIVDLGPTESFTELHHGTTDEVHKVTLTDAANFLIALIQAMVWRTVVPLHRTLKKVSARKSCADTQIFDAKRASGVLRRFRTLRAYAFSTNGKCLFHSLVLVNFLSRYDIYPSLVIGIRSKPWGAHCWVQQDTYVIDVTPERIFPYTPS